MRHKFVLIVGILLPGLTGCVGHPPIAPQPGDVLHLAVQVARGEATLGNIERAYRDLGITTAVSPDVMAIAQALDREGNSNGCLDGTGLITGLKAYATGQPINGQTVDGRVLIGLARIYATGARISPSTLVQSGRTYYVAPWGDNANPGTRDQPWATPGYGSRQLTPGDTLVILGGRYVLSEYDADIITPPSGTADAWITIKGEEGNRPVLAGRNNLLTAIDLSGAQYVRIENLEITHDATVRGEAAWFRDGLEILGEPVAHIVLKDLYIHHVDEFGMNIQDVEDLQILHCRIEYAGFGALGGPAGEHGGWRNVVIRGCVLSYSGHYYQGGDGSDRPYDRPDGFGIEPSQGPVLIEDTIVEHNYGDGIDSKAANTTIRRTIVANNSSDGVKLWGDHSRVENTLIYGRGDGNPEPSPWAAIVIDQVETPGASFEIVNVTVDDLVGQNYLMYVQYEGQPVRLTVRNTIFSGRGPRCPIYVGGESTLVADHNLFYLPQSETVLIHGDRAYTAASIGDLGPVNFYGDPLFVRPAWGEEGNYHLQEGSPAIDAGSPEDAPADDLEGRPRDDRPDIGAYEY
ncbi:MAG: right-handed parallel beta-helix repeat-containing protein [Acidobacteria bacterium]|nr:MAG: right-handed parallel beta-helix repeat-containing protein [Acidobacteriota bacterium]